jgi:hypothetical protein
MAISSQAEYILEKPEGLRKSDRDRQHEEGSSYRRFETQIHLDEAIGGL